MIFTRKDEMHRISLSIQIFTQALNRRVEHEISIALWIYICTVLPYTLEKIFENKIINHGEKIYEFLMV